MTYVLDKDGNRTKLWWDPGWDSGYYVGYCYDNLNRMIVAMENSTDSGCNTDKLATYTYDPLSRRTGLTYKNGASIAYSYSDVVWGQSKNRTLTANCTDPNCAAQNGYGARTGSATSA